MIELSNICKTYKTGNIELNALVDLNLSIDKGEFVSIMGASGSGKSTFMNILGCLDKPTQGSYILNGVDINKLSISQLAEIRSKSIGFVFQSFNLIQRATAIENVELPMIYSGIKKEERLKRTHKVLNEVGLQGRETHLPTQLSGGQQQRVAIARAIVNNAPIILADEPTGNLDTKTSDEIMDLFVKLNKEENKTIILVTHEDSIAMYSKRIIKFKDGVLISDFVKG